MSYMTYKIGQRFHINYSNIGSHNKVITIRGVIQEENPKDSYYIVYSWYSKPKKTEVWDVKHLQWFSNRKHLMKEVK